MTDIVLESIQATVAGLITLFLLRSGKRSGLTKQRGWRFLVAGFVFLFAGSIFDITDNFESLNRFHVIGDTPTEALLEKIGGALFGSLLLFAGFWHWLPMIGALRRAEAEITVYSERLGELVEERSAELRQANVSLRREVDVRSRAERERVGSRNRLILDSAGEGICGLDTCGKITFANSSAARMIGAEMADLIGRDHHALVHPTRNDGSSYPADECPVHRRRADGVAIVDEAEWIVTSDGGRVPIEFTRTPIREGDEITGSVVVFRDVTDRRRAEEEIRSSLKEKEVLLREIHHRVKNNFQAVSSLLNLQLNLTGDDAAADMLRDSQDRIRSMALIHESLYRSSSLALVEFGDYIQNLLNTIAQSHGSSLYGVRFSLEADEVFLDVETATPCGLIVSELVTNSMKHAFPDGRGGEINVELRSEPAGLIRLTVSDDGVGIPEGMEFPSKESLGTQLVATLVDDLEGAIAISGDGGATFAVTFTPPDPLEPERPESERRGS